MKTERCTMRVAFGCVPFHFPSFFFIIYSVFLLFSRTDDANICSRGLRCDAKVDDFIYFSFHIFHRQDLILLFFFSFSVYPSSFCLYVPQDFIPTTLVDEQKFKAAYWFRNFDFIYSFVHTYERWNTMRRNLTRYLVDSERKVLISAYKNCWLFFGATSSQFSAIKLDDEITMLVLYNMSVCLAFGSKKKGDDVTSFGAYVWKMWGKW